MELAGAGLTSTLDLFFAMSVEAGQVRTRDWLMRYLGIDTGSNKDKEDLLTKQRVPLLVPPSLSRRLGPGDLRWGQSRKR